LKPELFTPFRLLFGAFDAFPKLPRVVAGGGNLCQPRAREKVDSIRLTIAVARMK